MGQIEFLDLRATCLGLAETDAAAAHPIVLWGRAGDSLCLGPRTLHASHSARSIFASRDEADALTWVEAGHCVFAILAPVRFAPRCARRLSWGLAPALATYRQFGVHAYLDGDAICLHGRPVADSSTWTIAGWSVVASSFPDRCGLAARAPAGGERPSFRAWLRGGAALARSEWADPDEMPAERQLEEMLRLRIEAQYGWKFEHSWPDPQECGAIERMRSALEPLVA